MIVTAQINIETPAGRKIVRELEKHHKLVKIEYPVSEGVAGQRTYTLDESFNECCDILSEHYGEDVRKL